MHLSFLGLGERSEATMADRQGARLSPFIDLTCGSRYRQPVWTVTPERRPILERNRSGLRHGPARRMEHSTAYCTQLYTIKQYGRHGVSSSSFQLHCDPVASAVACQITSFPKFKPRGLPNLGSSTASQSATGLDSTIAYCIVALRYSCSGVSPRVYK
jgi:hypothetical protein